MHLKHQYDQILTSIITADIKTFMKEEILTSNSTIVYKAKISCFFLLISDTTNASLNLQHITTT